MRQIPFDSFSDTAVKGFFRVPAQFAGDFSGIDGISHIVSGAVFDKGDLFCVGFAILPWMQFIQQFADFADDIDIAFFVVSADIVTFAGSSGGGDQIDSNR